MTHQEQTQREQSFCPWAEFGHIAKIQGWIEELKKTKGSQPTAKDWRLMGRAVMICHPIDELRKPLIKKIAHEAGYDYLWISGETFFEWVNESKPIPVGVPVIVHVEQGVWSGKIDDNKKAAEELAEFQANDLPNYLSELPNDLIAVFVITGKSYTDLNPSIRTVGSVDRRFDIAEPTLLDLGSWFLNQIGTELCDESLLKDTGRVGKLVNDEFEDRRRQRLIALHLQRRANREARQLSFDDLVYFAVHGGSETEHAPEEDAEMLHRIAIHEAGHALISILDSNGRNIPDFASITPGGHFKGVVADSYAYSLALTGRYTYEDSRHKVRVQLAGRIAESIVLGATKVGTFGARSDLRNATAWAKELMGLCGFSPEQENPDAVRDNLAVIDDEASASEAAHIEAQTRLFLKRQYEAVALKILDNRAFLDAITHALLERRVLNQNDLAEIFKEIQLSKYQTPLDEKRSNFTVINPILTQIIEHIIGEHSLDAQWISRMKVPALSNAALDQMFACIKKHHFQRRHGIAFYAQNRPPLLYTANLLASCSGLSLEQILGKASVPDATYQKICAALDKLIPAPIYFDDTHEVSSSKRMEALLGLERILGPTKLGAVICDRSELLDDRFLDYCSRQKIEVVIIDH